jgi:hypothetical protein
MRAYQKTQETMIEVNNAYLEKSMSLIQREKKMHIQLVE